MITASRSIKHNCLEQLSMLRIDDDILADQDKDGDTLIHSAIICYNEPAAIGLINVT